MRHVLILLLLPCMALAGPEWAVVQMPSHGGSGTVIWSDGKTSKILSCAHAFQGSNRYKPVTFKVPHPTPAGHQKPGIRLIDVDYQSDLALLEINIGMPYLTPIAPPDERPTLAWSVGYDAMTWPAVVAPATLVGTEGAWTYTRERPRPGRSGGGLIDQNGYLIGVCYGYEIGGRGKYASHASIMRFMKWPGSHITEQGRPYVTEQRQFNPFCPDGNCPGGICPIPGR